jgi:hypothetical protein
MRLRLLICGTIISLGAAATLSAAPLVSNFSVTSPTQVPNQKLSPGSYSITVVDHLSDRVVLRIDDGAGKIHDTFLGVPIASQGNGGATGPFAWSSNSDQDAALRGFTFPGGGAVEFVYPKDEAVAIAQKSGRAVPAIDPASEGMVVKDSTLSKQDMAMVTLWTLTPTAVGPSDAAQPAIQAARYQAPQSAQPLPQQVAQNEPPSAPPSPMHQTVTRKPVLPTLPHTASDLPFFFIGGLLSVLAAALLSLVRRENDGA